MSGCCCSPLGPAPSPSSAPLAGMPLAGGFGGPSFGAFPVLPNSGQPLITPATLVQLLQPTGGMLTPKFSPMPLLPNLGQFIGFSQQSVNGAAIGPAATVTYTTAAFQVTRTGILLIWGQLGANNSGVSTQTGTLRLDVAGADTVLDNSIAGTGGAGPFNLGFLARAVVTKTATHTLSVRAVASAGTNTIPIGLANIMIFELPI